MGESSMSCTSRVYVADSDDSDNEGGLGNVERVVMRPPGHSGKAKKGHLCFDAIYETGNLGRVDFINDYEYDLFIRPDTCNPRYRFWFNFSVENVHVDQRIIFNIVNISKTRNLFAKGMTPIVRSTSRPKWQRIPRENVYYYKSPEHSNNFVLSFAFAFDRDEERYQFSCCYPYSYSRLQLYIDEILAKKPTLVTREVISKSIKGRNLDLLTITEPNAITEEPVKKRIVMVLGRQHPGESPSSFVVQGLIDFLLSKHNIAKELREKLIFKIIPMMNPDGVFLGNYRGSLIGTDLNRVWHESDEHVNPTVFAVDQLIQSLSKSKETPLDFVLDIHISNTMLGLFILGNAFDSVFRNERHIVFPKMMAQNCKDFSHENTMYNKDPDKQGTARRHLAETIESQDTNVYSVEVSMYGYKPDPKSNEIIPYTEENCEYTFF
ncbi:cytosolic carboxypeptidase 6 [Eurytemora carolleeae]|uniref:cytosolic carboxypeptidase 6 n=1 Tax=Eurytemora carolleeae TaxID=1294199 RepID=UPI000C75EFB7|nr:cytosolic carboxypeptidase 6 [Eurytemora carolleeae]|eukprot:XP_023345018.1 cytosolic carboxypeptidase 6-like [Eurytemora affinis]